MTTKIEEEDKAIFTAWALLQTLIWLITIYIFSWLLFHYQSDSKLFWTLICIGVLLFDTILYMLYTWQWHSRKTASLRKQKRVNILSPTIKQKERGIKRKKKELDKSIPVPAPVTGTIEDLKDEKSLNNPE